MLNKLTGVAFVLLLSACANNTINETTKTTDTVAVTTDSSTPATIDTPAKAVDVLSFARDSILQLMEAKQYAGLAHFISDEGISISPYGLADTAKTKMLSRTQFLALLNGHKKMFWGYADGSGDSILLTIPEYFKKYVYDVPFVKAEQTSINKVIDPDAANSKVPSVYAGNTFVQFYFPGFNKKYEGMDWKSLLLVFKQQESKYYLVAIVHNQWKI
jgi:hypothetical protein